MTTELERAARLAPALAIQLHELSPNHFFTSRQRIEFCRVIGFAQDVLSFLVLMHAQKYFPEARHDRFWNILAH